MKFFLNSFCFWRNIDLILLLFLRFLNLEKNYLSEALILQSLKHLYLLQRRKKMHELSNYTIVSLFNIYVCI